ncbi:hypothetical protein Sd1012_4198 [Shigella dysenteriae 1012]|nr:hypothetical protein Sd1012_4198 [Shigella dysenteriae 1012]
MISIPNGISDDRDSASSSLAISLRKKYFNSCFCFLFMCFFPFCLPLLS